MIADPEVKEFKIDDKMDFLLLVCKYPLYLIFLNHFSFLIIGDGIFDKISNEDVIR